ncbi:MAG: ATP-binding cassette domain-containing protein [Coriobacteriia bacterium]|nr:ATP-binding cassette domain-containing protein [Coriobacteriia bacterium]MCL2745649.1 ATP-binding cassette domain-containing protein [Coriobacteriia bacterium]MCL2870510.1 ATP-binding cassette domain-containing protein [Coriobacteriia bacterium]
MNTAIQINEVSKSFGKQEILKSVTMEIKKGEIYGLLGANGAGKTTLMKAMLDLVKSDSGTISIMGKMVGTNDEDIFRKIGNIIETPVFYQNLSVEDNLKLHCDYVDPSYKQEIDDILRLVGLEGVNKRKVKTLSLGMKQRLAIGRAFLCRPDILILDEPINGLDPKGIVDVRELILRLNKEYGVTILISSHIISELAKVSDTIGILDNGYFIEEISMATTEVTDLEEYFLDILTKSSLRRSA